MAEDDTEALEAVATPLPYERVKDLANDYNETVLALISFSALVCHDGRARRSESHFAFGRRMLTSTDNPISPSATVTPDLVAQKSATYGIVAEVKKQLSRSTEQWAPHLRQLRKYDDELTGWWTPDEKIERSDAVLLVHQSRTRAFVRYLTEEQAKDPNAVGPRTAVVEFNRSDESKPYLFFRKESGMLGDSELDAALADGRQVPMHKVQESFPSLKFYDAEPPIESLMGCLWVDYFMSRFDFAACLPGDDPEPIIVGVADATEELKRAYGSSAAGMARGERCTEFPKQAWIRKALREFVQIGLAEELDSGSSFRISFRRSKADVVEWICKLRVSKQKPAKPHGQLALELDAS